jgi:ubiquitin carboxyl-terminal hydrolase 4/11/15
MIKRKLLEKIATFTTWDEFLDSESESVDQDMVLTTGSDADSSGGSKVVATSIDGEDELVDVTMKDSPPRPSMVNGPRPKFISPKSYLKPSLQNMFEVGYFSGSKEMVPSGWNHIDEDKAYPSISSRNPQPEKSADEDSINGFGPKETREGSESSDEAPYTGGTYDAITRGNEESSDEDEAVPPPVRKVSCIFVIPSLLRISLESHIYSQQVAGLANDLRELVV